MCYGTKRTPLETKRNQLQSKPFEIPDGENNRLTTMLIGENVQRSEDVKTERALGEYYNLRPFKKNKKIIYTHVIMMQKRYQFQSGSVRYRNKKKAWKIFFFI